MTERGVEISGSASRGLYNGVSIAACSLWIDTGLIPGRQETKKMNYYGEIPKPEIFTLRSPVYGWVLC